MHAQSDLFDPPRARRSDPATSHAAAAQAIELAQGERKTLSGRSERLWRLA
jgi:hypothetical protein